MLIVSNMTTANTIGLRMESVNSLSSKSLWNSCLIICQNLAEHVCKISCIVSIHILSICMQHYYFYYQALALSTGPDPFYINWRDILLFQRCLKWLKIYFHYAGESSQNYSCYRKYKQLYWRKVSLKLRNSMEFSIYSVEVDLEPSLINPWTQRPCLLFQY